MKLQYKGHSQNPGSIAQGGEMTLALVNALSKKGNVLDLNQILADFFDWHGSKPADLHLQIEKFLKQLASSGF